MVSLLTALIIQGNETKISPYQDESSQKWGYEVSRVERGNHRPLVTCSPIYDSEETAKREGDGLVKSIRELNLSPKRQELGDLLSGSKEVVRQVIDVSHSQ